MPITPDQQNDVEAQSSHAQTTAPVDQVTDPVAHAEMKVDRAELAIGEGVSEL